MLTGLNGHCRNPRTANQLRALGPLYVAGASVSHGLFATSFPKLIAEQMCLDETAYDADFKFLFFFNTNKAILKSILRMRPNMIVAMDYPYHYVKLKHASEARPILQKLVTMLLLECESELIDCREDGSHHYLRRDPYRPIVFAGTIYYDCKSEFESEERESEFASYEVCREENIKLNQFYRELEDQYPNLYLLPAFEMFSALHDTKNGEFHYDINDVQRTFKHEELFFDGFHPWTNPGAYVLANVVIDWINRANQAKAGDGFTPIPYFPISAKPTE